ncbi:MAG TPA: DUF6250 domain-containing protein [Steroidobacteraceae bacterium]|jgi:hypothetical protein|nr:DUF6250 domain-containing protein [Steroidobacteraceae bacterium]
MSSTASSRTFVSALFLALAGCATAPGDDFRHGLDQWHIEAEKPGHISAANGVLDIDVPAGVTLWFKPRLQGPVRIEFDATAVAEGGPNDKVSDLNVFWMANNADGREPVFARQRGGAFAQYNDLLTYYVGLGGNRNSTTRFRRYIGDPVNRPLLPEHDLAAPSAMLVPNRKQTITLIAAGSRIEYLRDGARLFLLEDAAPYVNGWFALRTTFSHLRIERLYVRKPGK